MATPNILLRAQFGDFVVDFESFELRKHGIRLKLQHQPFQVLSLLLQHPGQLVTREQLCTELWAGSTFVDFDAGLNAAIRRLRDVLCDSADQPRYIETLPRHGYRFIAPVEVLAEAPAVGVNNSLTTPEEMTPEESVHGVRVPPEILVKSQTNFWVRVIVPTCVLVLTLGLGAFTIRSKVLARHLSDSRIYSIAVLPLQNLSGDPSQDYFADGMTDALITNLAQSGALLRVISSTSSMRYKNVRKGLPEIGRELNVGLVLEGSVLRSGNHVRVSAQLVDAAKDQHLWARQYDRDLQDVLQLQAELASAVALEVTGKLTSLGQAPSTTNKRKINPQAYEAYLKGEYFLNKWSEEGFDRAKGYFEQSISLDPGYADAYAGLAEYYGLVAFTASTPPREAWLKAEELLAKTLTMDPRSVKAHTGLGMIKLQYRCDRVGAEKELDYALQLNPGDMSALDYHSYYLLEIGRTDEAIAEKRRVLEHDPLSVITNAELPLYLLQAGRTDEAIVQLQKALELDANYAPTHMRLGLAYMHKKQYESAALEMQKAIALDRNPMRLTNLGELYALWGKKKEALQIIAQLQGMSKHRYVAPNMIALVYARSGDKTAALDWLKKAKPEDDPKITDSGFDILRSDPQFKTLEARLKPNPSCPPF
jgi:TolB-like protein/DNA-binding winged helix-turn-helix (wHTH) protein/Flp pilus assembly protein TadD